MGLKSLLVFITLLFFSNLSFAQSCDSKQNTQFTYSDLVQLIKNPDCKIKSIKDVISKLPQNMSNNVVLINQSRSLQGPHRSDYVNPRTILHSMVHSQFAPAIALTFNGHKSQANYLSLEVMAVDVSKNYNDMFEYRDIKFPDEEASKQLTWEQVQSQIKFSEKNPQTCQHCHGNPARPIFEQYPNWEGAIGRRHTSVLSEEEKIGLKSFIDTHKNNIESRYHSLDLSRFVGDITFPHRPKEREVVFGTGEQNMRFNAQLFAYDSYRVIKMIQASETYKNLKYAYWAAAKECKNINNFFPNNLLNELKRNVLKRVDTKTSIADLRKTFPHSKSEEFGGGDGAEILHSDEDLFRIWHDTANKQGLDRKMPSAVFFRLLVEGQAFQMHKFWMDIVQPSYRMNSGAGEAWYYAFEKLEPEISNLSCEQLEQKSYEHLTKNPISVKDYQAEPTPPKQDYPLVFSKTCARCHDSAATVAAPIPFTNKESFRSWLALGVNRSKILFKINPKRTLGKMPPNRDLTDDERQEIYNFLNYKPAQ